jgi:RNA recognition motif-containing protein
MVPWLFVDRLPPDVTRDQLTALFSPFGVVVRAFIFESSTPSRHIAFVEMDTEEASHQAAQDVDHSEFLGQRIRVLKIGQHL